MLIILVFVAIIHLRTLIRRTNEIPEEFEKRRFNYSLMLPYIEPKFPQGKRRFVMVLVVNSAANGTKHRQLRQAIRKTWGDSLTSLKGKHTWGLFFVLGNTENDHEHQANLQEAIQYNDVIIGNFTDHYYSIATKTFMGHNWATKRLVCQYIMKTDDDVYVRVPQTITWLQDQGFPRSFYGGHIKNEYLKVEREKTSKWYLTTAEFPKDAWQPYCHGAFHIMSTDIVKKLLNFTNYRTPYFADDAYIGDILLSELHISPTEIQGFGLGGLGLTDCQLIGNIAIGHRIDSRTMVKYHEFYQTYSKDEDGSIAWKCSFWVYRKYLSKFWA